MPRYEYRCEDCGQVFEVQQKFIDSPLEMHDGCGGRLERLISASAIQFKGSGWYVTDYARSAAGRKDTDKDSPAKTESKDPAKTDTKESAKNGSDTPSKPESKNVSKPSSDK